MPVITDAGTPRLAVNTYRLNVRSGPGVGHPVLTSVGGGTELPVISIHADRLWYEVASPAGNGWVNSYYAVTRGDFSRLSSTNAPVQTSPVLTGTTPRAVVNTSRLNIRSGPGVAHGVITSVQGVRRLQYSVYPATASGIACRAVLGKAGSITVS